MNPQTDFLSFSGLVETVVRRWRVMAACVAIGITLGAGAILLTRRTYRGRLLAEVQLPNENYLNRRFIDPTLVSEAVGFESYLQTQLRLMQTDALYFSVAERLKLGNHPDFEINPNLDYQHRRAALLEALSQRMKVRLSGETRIIEITFESGDPALAAAVPNELIAAFIRETGSRRQSATGATVRSLNGQLEEARTRVNEAEERLRDFAAGNALLLSGRAGGDTIQQAELRQLQSSWLSAQEQRSTEEGRYRMARSTPAEAFSAAVESTSLSAYRVKLTEIEQKLAEASAIYNPTHYRVQQLQAEREEVKRAFDRERGATLLRMKSQYENALVRERQLRQAFETQARRVSVTERELVRFQSLRQEADAARKLYEDTLARVQEASLASALPASAITVADPALPPVRPIRPNKAACLALGLAGGICAGLAIVLLGARPALPAAAAAITVRQQPEVLDLVSTSEEDVASFAKRLTGESGCAIVISAAGSSTAPAEFAIQLGTAAAACGKGVLLIDADREQAGLAELMGLAGTTGWMDSLGFAGGGDLIQLTGTAGLYLLPWGEAPANAASWNSRFAVEMIRVLRPAFDLVIVVAESLAHGKGAPELSAATDGLLLVREGSAESRAAMLDAAATLPQGTPLLGAAVIQAAKAVAAA